MTRFVPQVRGGLRGIMKNSRGKMKRRVSFSSTDGMYEFEVRSSRITFDEANVHVGGTGPQQGQPKQQHLHTSTSSSDRGATSGSGGGGMLGPPGAQHAAQAATGSHSAHVHRGVEASHSSNASHHHTDVHEVTEADFSHSGEARRFECAAMLC